jgi:hypothetical protein
MDCKEYIYEGLLEKFFGVHVETENIVFFFIIYYILIIIFISCFTIQAGI